MRRKYNRCYWKQKPCRLAAKGGECVLDSGTVVDDRFGGETPEEGIARNKRLPTEANYDPDLNAYDS